MMLPAAAWLIVMCRRDAIGGDGKPPLAPWWVIACCAIYVAFLLWII